MKKLFLSLVAAIVVATATYAQSSLVATLSHGSNVSNYYGIDALSEAYMAAVDGDVITLSSGNFNAVNIEKAITVRGAGMKGLDNGAEPTHLSGAFTISKTITLEGVDCLKNVGVTGNSGTPVNILKCRFGYGIDCTADANFVHCLLNCRDGSNIKPLTASGIITINCQNCVLFSPNMYYNAVGNFTNCIISGSLGELNNCNLRNCAIIGESGKPYGLPSSATANYCVAWYYNPNTTGKAFENVSGANNSCIEDSNEAFFKTYGGYFADVPETFELTETAAATYLGDDGKQVGIYGGTNPFDPTPTNPQITKFTVDSSVNSGKLSVKINVE